MQILVEPSDYELLNRGDAASMKVSLERMRSAWPDARIEVLTDDPELLSALAPSVTPRSTAGHVIWNRPLVATQLPGPLATVLGPTASFVDAALRQHWPRVAERALPRTVAERALLAEYVDAVARADLVVVTGMGGITDVFRQYAVGVLATLAIAARHGVPTAMMSQQVGPITSWRLARLARHVLPHVDLIALREATLGLPLLRRLGVDPRSIRTTGDDTVSYVYARRGASLGTALGVNLRRSGYARMDGSCVERVREAMAPAISQLAVPVQGLPVSHRPEEDDRQVIGRLAERPARSYPAVVDLDGYVQLVQECRVVVSGSYHGAVFALAQGVPTVCLTNSPYYDQKFFGLRALFGDGCHVVRLGPDLGRELVESIERLWACAGELREPLLDSAQRQVQMGEAAYRALTTLVEGSDGTPPRLRTGDESRS